MTTPAIRAASLAALALATLGGSIALVLAHDPHEAPATGSFDINSPRHLSPLTARYIDLQTAEVDFGSVESVVRLTGTVRPLLDLTSIVTSAVPGTIVRLDARIGDHVRRGQPIGIIQSAELARMVIDLHKAEIEAEHAVAEIAAANSNIAQLRNQITSAEAQAAILEDELARLQTAGDGGSGGGAVSANVIAAKRASALQSRAQVSTLKLSLTQAENTLDSLGKIRASTAKSILAMQAAIDIIHAHPDGIDMAQEARAEGESGGTFVLHARIDGVVTRRDAVPGQGVEPGKPILTIVDYSQVLIEGELPESMIPQFASASGQHVRIRRPGAPPGEAPIATGEVRGISPTVDPIKRTAHLLIISQNPAIQGPGGHAGATGAERPNSVPTLQEGMFVSLAVTTSPGVQSVVIPISALITDGPTPFVFIKDGDAYIKRDILPGARNDRFLEVKDGLVPGDVVVTKGAYLLTQLRPAAAAAAAPEDHNHDHGHSH